MAAVEILMGSPVPLPDAAKQAVLSRPLVAVGGQTGPKHWITFYMHEGYDRPSLRIDDMAAIVLGRVLKSGSYLVLGSRENPLYRWPVYARVEIDG